MKKIRDFGYHILFKEHFLCNNIDALYTNGKFICISLLKNDKFEHRKTTRVYIQDNFLCHVSTKLSKHKTLILGEERPSKFSNISGCN